MKWDNPAVERRSIPKRIEKLRPALHLHNMIACLLTRGPFTRRIVDICLVFVVPVVKTMVPASFQLRMK